MKNYDVVIVGAGLVGTSLAIALQNLSLKVALIDATPLKHEMPNADGKSIALTEGSARILQALNVWQQLANYTTNIDTVHISHRGQFGFTRIHAREENVTALGYVIPANRLTYVLNKILADLLDSSTSYLTLFNPATVQSLNYSNSCWQINLTTENKIETLQARLLVAADGTHSTIRQLLDIPVRTSDHRHSAIATTLALDNPHRSIAYERFIEQGAIALLPLKNDRQAGLVLTGEQTLIDQLQALNDAEFLKQAQYYFGYRAGKFLQLGQRYSYPLKMLYAEEQIKPGLVLIGNAAHTLHPIAAQGFNLGLLDVAWLTQTLSAAISAKQDYADLSVLKPYAEITQLKQQRTMQFTNALTRIFTYDFLPINLIRNSSLLALDLLPPLKHAFAKRLMGMQGKLPKLMCEQNR